MSAVRFRAFSFLIFGFFLLCGLRFHGTFVNEVSLELGRVRILGRASSTKVAFEDEGQIEDSNSSNSGTVLKQQMKPGIPENGELLRTEKTFENSVDNSHSPLDDRYQKLLQLCARYPPATASRAEDGPSLLRIPGAPSDYFTRGEQDKTVLRCRVQADSPFFFEQPVDDENEARKRQTSRGDRHSASHKHKYVLGVTTGHSGTTSLSKHSSYRARESVNGEESVRKYSNVLFTHENFFEMDDWWQEWWHDKEKKGYSPDSKEYSGENRRRAVEKYKRVVDEHFRDYNMKVEKTVLTDLGHHVVQGALEFLPEVFGKRLLIIRVRRARLHTALSFHGSLHLHKPLCKRKYNVCPLRNPHLLLPKRAGGRSNYWASSENFDELSRFQQFLWYIDEVETQWQALLRNNPDVSYIECDWSADLEPCFQAIALATNVTVPDTGGQHTRIHIKDPAADVSRGWAKLAEEDQEYQEFMVGDRN